MGAPLVWINGFPGVGKLTIATALQAIDEHIILIDNHKMIDPVEAKFSRDHPDYQRERRAQREAVFARHVTADDAKDHTIVFTDCQSDNDLGRAVATEYKLAAETAGRDFIPVYLSCDKHENLKRVSSAERVGSKTTKLTSKAILKDILSNNELFRFEGCSSLTLDITQLSPAEAALQIRSHIQKCAGETA
ncbi:uncharacterized protein B0I36DRAFT_123022 [Microdochium trichocladiopsis]|uniref:Uncharacterized protein n=1 Tax=Microdochium trichocladiopsis TaxID=1682393 RepID=A0A9P9BR02_9PEZI|nr:uncharacterized protein B0I36DRAFT_123022 [Microdochium trichocladiopsis]KAH7031458.1 hypothetical protein B0I36DRAFT_123022 [Microdochium trichocladiopsis]